MTFKVVPVPRTYVDISEVTNPLSERLKVTLESGKVIYLKLAVSGPFRPVLEIDQEQLGSDIRNRLVESALENRSNTRYSRYFLGIRHSRKLPKLSAKEATHELVIQCHIDPDGGSFDQSPMVGKPLRAMVGLREGGASGCTIDPSPVKTIESVTLP